MGCIVFGFGGNNNTRVMLFLFVNPEEIIRFLVYSGRLKHVPRTGWVESGVDDPESVADHSFRTALAAMVLSDELGLDTLKVTRMALLHDLAETETGDITPKMKEANHMELEDKAMRKILSVLPDSVRSLYWDVWCEYQENISLEAVLVHDADKIEMVLQAKEYSTKNPDSNLERFFHAMVSSSMKKIVEKIKNDQEFG